MSNVPFYSHPSSRFVLQHSHLFLIWYVSKNVLRNYMHTDGSFYRWKNEGSHIGVLCHVVCRHVTQVLHWQVERINVSVTSVNKKQQRGGEKYISLRVKMISLMRVIFTSIRRKRDKLTTAQARLCPHFSAAPFHMWDDASCEPSMAFFWRISPHIYPIVFILIWRVMRWHTVRLRVAAAELQRYFIPWMGPMIR